MGFTVAIARKYKIPPGVRGTCSLERIVPKTVTYLSDPRYANYLKPNMGLIVLVSKEQFNKVKSVTGNQYRVVKNPLTSFIEIHNDLHRDFEILTQETGKPRCGKHCFISTDVSFGSNVSLGNNVKVYAYATLGSNVRIGDNTIIYPGVTICNDTSIGARCVIDSGAVIGAEGFSATYDTRKGAVRLYNVGKVKIGNDAEIGVHSIIDRGSMFDTIIGNRVKINNFVHIGHNCIINDDVRIGVKVIVSGSTEIGKRAWIANGSLLRDHIKIGQDAQVLMGSVVIDSVPPKARVGGHYAMPHEQWKNHIAEIKKQKH